MSDLEPRFGCNQLNTLTESGVPNHLFRFATRVFGMTPCGYADFPRTPVLLRGNDGVGESGQIREIAKQRKDLAAFIEDLQ